jgi:hypothetical protein
MYCDLSNGSHNLIMPQDIPNCSPSGSDFVGPLSLTYSDTSMDWHYLTTVYPFIGKCTLGVRIALVGNWTDKFKYRLAQSCELALLLAGCVLPKDTARICYPLAVTQFTQAECNRISSPVLRACMSKMGYNRNMPK